MIPISPLSEEHLSRFVGAPVCAMTHDGKCHYGILRSCENGHIYLNEGRDELVLTALKKKAKTSARMNVKRIAGHSKTKLNMKRYPGLSKAKTSAWGWGWGWGAGLAISLAALTALFFIPFFFI
ncbi:hypothetical protein [Cohnella nanjingensis]|uniref:Uncharacterized protein n=1 Tax=Cohnella nanjingensis TaxID=1387779 RepID=A0A7X0RNT2_9BACL|nr:hypothetical protein [Cohnella nanjingensis]MBB6669484.1 hypothetical protein [Cohnella nanjingensis]